MLSFERGKAIAKVLDKNSRKEMNTIYINNDLKQATNYESYSFKDDLDPLASFDKDFFRKDKNKRRYLNPKEKQMLRYCLKNDEEPDNIALMGYYHDAKKQKFNRLNKEIFLDNDNLIIVPVPDHDHVGKKIIPKRECLYMSAPSGGGKSTYVANYAEQYKELFPKNNVYMFSRVDKDPSIDNIIKVKRIMINDHLVEDPIEPSELKNSLVIFDDIDTIKDKNQNKTVSDIRKDLLHTGRHEDVYVASTSHQITNYKETRDLLTESRGVTFFPGSGDDNHIEYFLSKYGGIRKKEEIDRILGLPSRWVTLYKSYPMYILYEQGVILLNNPKVKATQLKNDPNVFNYNDELKEQTKPKPKKKKIVYEEESTTEESDSESEEEQYDYFNRY